MHVAFVAQDSLYSLSPTMLLIFSPTFEMGLLS